MNDHQDSENFSYEREWKDIYDLLHEAERKQNQTHEGLQGIAGSHPRTTLDTR